MAISKSHGTEVLKLKSLEEKLVRLIATTDNTDLMSLFLEWQDQRNVCNKILLTELNRQLTEKK